MRIIRVAFQPIISEQSSIICRAVGGLQKGEAAFCSFHHKKWRGEVVVLDRFSTQGYGSAQQQSWAPKQHVPLLCVSHRPIFARMRSVQHGQRGQGFMMRQLVAFVREIEAFVLWIHTPHHTHT